MEPNTLEIFDYSQFIIEYNETIQKLIVIVPSHVRQPHQRDYHFYDEMWYVLDDVHDKSICARKDDADDGLVPWTFMSSSLRDAAHNGDVDLVIELINDGAEINESDAFGNTPLWLAYANNHYEIVAILLNAGVDVNYKTGDYDITDMHRACGWGSTEFVKLLMQFGGDVNAIDVYGKTPLIFAVDFKYKHTNSCLNTIDLLIDYGAVINQQDVCGLSPLHYACIRGNAKVVQELLARKANPCTINTFNVSPLTHALCYITFLPNYNDDYNKIVCLLIESTHVSNLKYTLGGNKTPNILALFNFIFYGLSKNATTSGSHWIEELGWEYYNEILRESLYDSLKLNRELLNVALNLIIFNQNLDYCVYFLQRIQLLDLSRLLASYTATSISYDKDQSRTNMLVLYVLLSDDGRSIKSFLDYHYEFYDQQDKTDHILESVLNEKSKIIFSLKCLSRRSLRRTYTNSLYVKYKNFNLPKSLQSYIFYEELKFYVKKQNFSANYLLNFLLTI